MKEQEAQSLARRSFEVGADPSPRISGILSDMQGAKGIAAWRWLFIIEGVGLSASCETERR